MHHLPSRYIPCDGRLTASAYFDPRSPHGELRGWFRSNTAAVHFNPRSPHGERPYRYFTYLRMAGFQSTLPAWGATRSMVKTAHYVEISIHAPRMGSDGVRETGIEGSTNFNPRSPHGERPVDAPGYFCSPLFQSTLPAWGATLLFILPTLISIFQSTLPAWGATSWSMTARPASRNFNPRSPHGERLHIHQTVLRLCMISIHAPRMGSD